LAIIATLSIALAQGNEQVSAKELQWRRGQVPNAKTTQSAPSQQFSKPGKAELPRRDAAVRPAAFEEDGSNLQLADAAPGGTTLPGVVDRGGQSENAQSTQLPFGNDAGSNAPADAASKFEEQLREPFGDLPQDTQQREPQSEQQETELPAFEDELDIETMELPENDKLQQNDTQLAPADRQPLLLPKKTIPTQPPQSSEQPAQDDRLPADRDRQPPPKKSVDTDNLQQEREKAQGVCSQELADMRASTLNEVDLSIIVAGTEGEDYPFECSVDDGMWHEGRCWEQTTYLWKASALCHKPLYFENEMLERYGHSWGPVLDPIVSGAHFFSRLPILPYCMGVEPPHECIYALGHYRPGSCAPYMINPVPISLRGALFQAGAVVGTAAALP
jgi:hypothetical protein